MLQRDSDETRRYVRSISSTRRSVAFYWRSFEVHVIIHAGVLRKDGGDMGNKMRSGKKCDFMININVAVTTARRGPDRGDSDGRGSETMLNDWGSRRCYFHCPWLMVKRFCRFLRATAEKAARYLGTSAVCTIGQQSRRCRESPCRKRRGRFTVTGTPIQDDTIRKQEGTNEAERFTYLGSTVRICKMYCSANDRKKMFPSFLRNKILILKSESESLTR